MTILWYPSGGGQSQSDTSQLTASGMEGIGCAAPRFYRDCRYFCRDSVQKKKKKGSAQKRSGPATACVHADKQQLRGRQAGAVTPSLCHPSCSPPSLRAKAGSHELCQRVLKSPLPDSAAGQAVSSQMPSTPPGRPKNISRVPTKHVF